MKFRYPFYRFIRHLVHGRVNPGLRWLFVWKKCVPGGECQGFPPQPLSLLRRIPGCGRPAMKPNPPPYAHGTLRVVPYDPALKTFFYSINYEWLEEYFSVTAEDESQLKRPEAILAGGGQVFFVLDGLTTVGTCAVVWTQEGTLELVKMGVLKAWRGRGAGRLLMGAVLAFAAAHKASRITLETASVLQPAIALYRRHGFQQVGEEYIHPLFGRKIVLMERMLHA